MNSIKRKNVIANFITKSELPYDVSQDVTLKSNQIANVALNYAFQKLLDNDLYVEQKLLLQSNYNFGPKPADEIDIKIAVDNYKYIDGIDNDENNLSIVQKISAPLTDTVSLKLGVKTNFILENNIYFAGTTNGLYQSNDAIEWKKTDIDSVLATTSINSYYSDESKILFATDSGIYALSCLENLLPSKSQTPEPVYVSCIYYNKDIKTTSVKLNGTEILIGTKDSLYYGQFDEKSLAISSVKSEKTVSKQVTCIETLSGQENDVVVGTTNGIYGSYRKRSFNNITTLSSDTLGFKCVYTLAGITYVGKSTGLFTYDNSTFTELYDVAGKSVKNVNKVVCINGKIYVCTAKGLYYLNNDNKLVIASDKLKNSSIKDIVENNGIIAIALNTATIYWTKDLDDDSVLNKLVINSETVRQLLVKNEITYCLTEHNLYQLELSDEIKTRIVKVIEIFSENVDVTCSYNGMYNEAFVGATTGLYTIQNNKLVPLEIYNTDKDTTVLVNGQFTIDDYVHNIHFVEIFGQNNYLICTNHGFYILNRTANGKYVLSGYHLFEDKDIIDAIVISDMLILVCADGFYTIDKINDTTENDYNALRRLKVETNYTFTNYANDIERLAKFNDTLVAYDTKTKNVDKFEFFDTVLSNKFSLYEQSANKKINALGQLNSYNGIYQYVIADNKVYVYQQISTTPTIQYGFNVLDDGTPVANSLSILNMQDENYANVYSMTPTLYTNNTIAYVDNSNTINVVNPIDLQRIDKQLSTDITFNDVVVGIGAYHYTNKYDTALHQKSEASIVATTAGIYANKTTYKANESFSILPEHNTPIKQFICFPYAINDITLGGIVRENLYYAITDANELLFFNSTREHEVDIGYLSPIIGTEIPFDNIQVKYMSVVDTTSFDTQDCERTLEETYSPIVFLATSDGLMSANIRYAEAGLYNIDNRLSDVDGNILSNDFFDVATLSTTTGIKAYAVAELSDADSLFVLNSNGKFEKVDKDFGEIIQVKATINHVYVQTRDDNGKYNILKATHDQAKDASKYSSINIISDKFFEIDILNDKLVINGNTLSTYDGVHNKFEEVQYSYVNAEGEELCASITADDIFKTYDQYNNKDIIGVLSNGLLLSYSNKVTEVCQTNDITHIVDDKSIVGYFIRDNDGHASTSERHLTELYITNTKDTSDNISAMYSIYKEVDYKLSNYNKIFNGKVNCMQTYEYMQAYLTITDEEYNAKVYELSTHGDPRYYNNLSASQIAVNEQYTDYIYYDFIFAGTDNGIIYTDDGVNFNSLNDIFVTDILRKPIKKLYVNQDLIFALTAIDNNNYRIIIVKYKIGHHGIEFISAEQSGIIATPNINNISNIKLEGQINDIYVCTNNGMYNTSFVTQIKKAETIIDSATCIYDTATNILIGRNDGLYNILNDRINKLNETKILHLYDGTTDTIAYVGGAFGISSGVIDNNRIDTYNTFEETLSANEVFNYVTSNEINYYDLDNSNLYVVANQQEEYHIVNDDYYLLYSAPTNMPIASMYDYSANSILLVQTIPQLFDVITKQNYDFETGLPSTNEVQKIWLDGKYQFIYTLNNSTQAIELFARNGELGKFDKLYIDDTAEIDEISYIGNNYIIDKNGLHKYESIANVRFFRQILPAKSVCSIYKIDDNNMLVGTTIGLYQYKNSQFIKNKAMSGAKVHAIAKAPKIDDNAPVQYFISLGNALYKSALASKNFNQFDFIFDLSKYNVDEIMDIICKSNREYTIATNNGTYITQDLFELSNTFKLQSISGIKNEIDKQYDSIMKQHIDSYHNANSPITFVNNNVMPINFSDIDQNWQQIDAETGNIISNDIVDTIEFQGDVNYIQAQYSNCTTTYDKTLSSYSYEQIEGISYIVKNWKSNIKEIYVYLPTTHTNYINHITGTPGCVNNTYKFKRNGMTVELSGNVDDACTKIRLLLDNKHFGLKDVYDIAINGNSLPLNIYVDDSKTDIGNANLYYHSYILPSISKFVPMKNSITNTMLQLSGDYAIFDFCCFGTDAQAIKITAKTPNVYYIKFNATDSTSGSMDIQKVYVDEKVALNECEYIRDGYIFVGWSKTPNGEIDYNNRHQIENLSYINGTIIELYAIWRQYIFDDSIDTVLKLNSNTKEFSIANGKFDTSNSNIIIEYI